MVSRFEPSEKKISFKKRSLRPWKPVIELDNSFRPDNKINLLSEDNHLRTEFPLEILHQPIENNLATKTKQREEIRAKLAALEQGSASITIGGFFKPRKILLLDEQESSEQTLFLVNALKDKEFEIAEINHQLKLAETIAEVQRGTLAVEEERKARMTAEEKTQLAESQASQSIAHIQSLKEQLLTLENIKHHLEQKLTAQTEHSANEIRVQQATRIDAENKMTSALQQLQKTNAQNLSLEAQLSASEQIKNKLEQRTLQLEQTLQEVSKNFESQLQKATFETQQLQNDKQFEIELRKSREDELALMNMQRQILENELNEKIKDYQSLEVLFEVNQAEIKEKIAESKAYEANLMVDSEELKLREQLLEDHQELSKQFEDQLQRVALETQKLENDKQFEIELRKNKEDELSVMNIEHQILQQELNEKIRDYQTLQDLYAVNQTEIKERIEHQQYLELQLIEERNSMQDQIAGVLEQSKKVSIALQAERDLRQHFEIKTRDLAMYISNLESRIQAEEQARELAEKKAKMTILKASETLIHALNQSENTKSNRHLLNQSILTQPLTQPENQTTLQINELADMEIDEPMVAEK